MSAASGPVAFNVAADGARAVFEGSGSPVALDFKDVKIHGAELAVENAKVAIADLNGQWVGIGRFLRWI